MEVTPLRKTYGITPSLLAGLVVLLIVLIGGNILLVLKTDFGSSFYGYWLAARILFAQGGDPYASSVFSQIVEKFPNDPNISGFTLPIYALLVVLPLSFINNFDVALIIWMLILEAVMVYAGVRLVRVLKLQATQSQKFLSVAVTLIGYYSFTAIIDGDLGPIALLFLLIALDAIHENEIELAGIMLAFATIKYSLTLLPILWICIWCLNHDRSAVTVWMGMILSLLFLSSMLFMTNWYVPFMRSCVYYFKYLNPSYFAGLIENWQPELGGRIGWAISGVLAAILILEWVLNAKLGADAFYWVLSMTFTVGFMIGVPNIGKNLYFLMLPILYNMNIMVRRWESKGYLYSYIYGSSFFLVPWLFHLIFAFHWYDPISPLNLIFPAVLFFLLYWNRWWVIDTFIERY